MFRLCVITVALFWSLLAHSHHSVMGAYDETNRVTIEAVVEKFEFINPHPFIIVKIIEATDNRFIDSIEAGELWTLEMDNKWELAELGFTKSTLEPGDRIIVIADPSRYKPHSLYVRVLEHLADGFRYKHNQRRLYY